VKTPVKMIVLGRDISRGEISRGEISRGDTPCNSIPLFPADRGTSTLLVTEGKEENKDEPVNRSAKISGGLIEFSRPLSIF